MISLPLFKSGLASSVGAYYQGQGLNVDKAESFERILEGAEQGIVFLQFNVGSMYAGGRGISPNYVQAYKWLSLSIAGSANKEDPLKKAKRLRESIAKKMTSQQIEEAEQLAREWESSYMQSVGDGSTQKFWGVKLPVILYQPLPSYTEEARNAHISGTVLIQCIIRKDGTADSFKIIKGLGYGLDESAINAIAKKWRFSPGSRNGVPVDAQISIQVAFMFN
jgi:TonB family protein